MLEKPDQGISPAEAARRLSVDPQTVRNWIKSGKLPATQWGPEGARIVRVDPSDLEGLGGLTMGQAAKRLGVHQRTIHNWIKAGKLRAETRAGAGGRMIVRIDPAELDALGPRPAGGHPSKPDHTSTEGDH